MVITVWPCTNTLCSVKQIHMESFGTQVICDGTGAGGVILSRNNGGNGESFCQMFIGGHLGESATSEYISITLIWICYHSTQLRVLVIGKTDIKPLMLMKLHSLAKTEKSRGLIYSCPIDIIICKNMLDKRQSIEQRNTFILFCPLDITVTSKWARQRLKSPASRLFTQPFIQAQIKGDIKALRHWPLWGEFSGDRWIACTKGK